MTATNNSDDKNSHWAIIKPVKQQVNFAMLLSSLNCLAYLGLLTCFAFIANALLVGRGNLIVYITVAVALTAVSFLLRIFAFGQSHYAAFRLETILRNQLAEHFAKVPLGYLQQIGSGALSKIIFDDVKELHAFVADSTPMLAKAYTMPLLTFIILLWLDWRLALCSIAFLSIGLIILSILMASRRELMVRYNAAREQVANAITEYVQAMPVVRTFDSGSATFTRYQTKLNDYLLIMLQWLKSVGPASNIGRIFFSSMPTLYLLLCVGAWLIWHEQLTFATWVAVLIFGVGIVESILPLMMLAGVLEKIKISIYRIQQCLAEPIMPPGNSTEQLPNSGIVFDNVCFSYREGQQVLHNVSFRLQPGTTTAIVGPSGSGKTTVARLIPRFWDIDSGQILIGGVDIRQLSSDSLMRQVSFVFQDNFLFATSVLENIRIGNPAASETQVMAAAEAAQAHEFILALPQGYQTQVGDRGIFLSGGQRQRITIARAILQNRPILILDEATSFADPQNETAIVTALSNLMRGKTVLVIAHRLNTITDVEQILVFDKGHLVESGRHRQLIAGQGVYARLWQNHEKAKTWTLGAVNESI